MPDSPFATPDGRYLPPRGVYQQGVSAFSGRSGIAGNNPPECHGLAIGLKYEIDVVPGHNPQGMVINQFYWGARQMFPSAYIIKDLKDMVDQLLHLTGDGCSKISRLTIFGHGNDEQFRVGDDCIDLEALKVESISGQFARLKYSFTLDGVVVLHSCHVGEDQALLMALAGLMGGVKVQAGDAYQLPIRELFGNVRTCTMTTCTTE